MAVDNQVVVGRMQIVDTAAVVGRMLVVGMVDHMLVGVFGVVARVPPLQALAWRSASWAWFRSTRMIVR